MTERKSFFSNLYDAMVQSRTRQVERELSQYREVLKVTLEAASRH